MSLHPACGHQALEKAARDGDPSRIVMSLPNTTSKTYSVCVMSNEPMLIHSRMVILLYVVRSMGDLYHSTVLLLTHSNLYTVYRLL
jgi:hypothetical protein